MPLTRPSPTPHRMPKGMASASPAGPQPVAAVDIMPPTATTQGTDKSIWPSRMTIIIPVAITPRKDATFSCCSRYSGERKLLEYRLPTSSSATMQPNAVAIAGSAWPITRFNCRVVTRSSREQVQSIADPEQTRRPETDRNQQHEALEQRLPERFEIEDEQQVADSAEHQRAKNRADCAARASEQRHSAEHDGGDRIQRVCA